MSSAEEKTPQVILERLDLAAYGFDSQGDRIAENGMEIDDNAPVSTFFHRSVSAVVRTHGLLNRYDWCFLKFLR